MAESCGPLSKSNLDHRQSSTEEERYTDADVSQTVSENTPERNLQQLRPDASNIGLKRSLESNDDDLEKATAVKRISTESVRCIRTERFGAHQQTTTTTSKSFKSGGRWVSPKFVEEWIRRNPSVSRSEQVEQAAEGIRQEGRLSNEISKSDNLAKMLLEAKDKSWTEVAERVLHVYTRDGFLYGLLNVTLREEDLSKVDTLGPFCDLLWNCLSCEHLKWKYKYTGTVYRGATLEPEAIEDYKKSIDKLPKEWLGFSSTTQDRSVAECFSGNTLFIIHLPSQSQHLDISSISQFPDEKEVLLGASTSFQIKAVRRDVHNDKYFIDMKVLW